VADEPDYLAVNRAWWDERATIHAEGEFYDLDGFVAGRDTLLPFEPELVGPVDGLDLVHLQCHIGLDTLSWARRGARVTGLDFSAPALDVARGLAERIGVDASFVEADVYDAVEVLGADFDIAYQSLGSLNWHPDMERWAGILARLVRPGGRYVLVEGHPAAWMLDDDGEHVAYPYFGPAGGVSFDDPGSYGDPDAETTNNRTIEFSHPTSDVITALLDAGFVLERFVEHPFTVTPMWPWLEERPTGESRTFWPPEGRPSLPLMYSVVARRPG
jgi:SAM-dependent methyltransferase